MVKSADIVIIGAGVTGAALAYTLAKRSIRALVLERRFPAAGATGRCGGGIRQQFTTASNIRLAMGSVRLYEGLSEELDCDIEFIQGGYLVLAETEAELELQARAVALQRGLGLPSEVLTPDQAREVFPLLDSSRIAGATFCPTDGHANPFRVVEGYLRAATRLGARLEKGVTVVGFVRAGERISEVVTDRGRIAVGMVVNAAGAWSREVAALAGVELPNRPVRHEIAVTEPIDRVTDVMVISLHSGIYFSQTVQGQILGGIGDPEEEPGYKLGSTLRFLRRYLGELVRLVPAFGQLAVMRQWAGLYDVTPDAQPVLGPTPGLGNFIQANGYSGHGFMIAPKVAEIIADYIEKGESSEDLKRLSLARFEKGKAGEGEAFVVG